MLSLLRTGFTLGPDNSVQDCHRSRALPLPGVVYVKFSQSCSIMELHRLRSERDFSRKTLGFQRLGGGLFAVATEVYTAYPEEVT